MQISILKKITQSLPRLNLSQPIRYLLIFLLILAVSLSSFYVYKKTARAWTDTGGGDHGGADWTPSNGVSIAGTHTNIGTFTITAGYTVYIQAFDGSNYGWLSVSANTVNVVGTLTASGKGYGGGGGGGGGGGDSDYDCGVVGQGAGGGSGDNGGGNGNTGSNEGGGNDDAGAGGSGNGGGGSFAGSGGSGGSAPSGSGVSGNSGSVGGRGGYATSGGQGDSSTDESINIGSGGAGAGGGSGGNHRWGGAWEGGGGGGGGAGGGYGGGYIKLYAVNAFTLSGSISTTGQIGSNGSNGKGTGQDAAIKCPGYDWYRGGDGGSGGSNAVGSGSGGSGGAGTGGAGSGGSGGTGGAGAAGGVLLYNNVENGITISGSFDALGGGSDTANGGTVKVFYGSASAPSVGSNNGRTYTADLPNSKPLTPGSPAASYVSDTQIDVSWTNTSAIEDGYRIYRSVDGGGYSELTTKAANSVSHSDTDVSANHKYQYYIVAYQGTQESDSSGNTSTVYTTPTAPSDAANSYVADNNISISWTDNSAYEDGFKIERSTDGGDYSQIDTDTASPYSDTTTSANHKYQYRVRVYKDSLNSSYSTAGSEVYTTPSTPTNAALQNISGTSMELSWTDNSAYESGFRIENSTNGINFSEVGTAAANATSYSCSALSPNTQYWFRVRSYIGDLFSSYATVAYSAYTIGTPTNIIKGGRIKGGVRIR